MSGVKFSVDTLGCKVNQSESDSMIKELQKKGMDLVTYNGHPDFCLVNTCTVTSRSDRKARQLIRRLKSENKNSKILVTGCFVPFNKKFLKECGIDLIVENDDKDRIPDLIIKEIAKEKNRKNFSCDDYPSYSGMHSRPLVKIQDGCEQNCTYCIVPRVRGKYSSVPDEKVLKKIAELRDEGFEEIVLTGIHIGKYGVDFNIRGPGCPVKAGNLADLLEKIIEDTGIKRIRISSIEVNEIDGRLLDILNRNQIRFAPHLHIPLQSGSDKILKLMGRPYTANYYFKKINKITGIFPDMALATDVMIGFPGEDDKDFTQTIDMIKKIAFSKIHVFKFSKRKHTSAYQMGGQVDEKVKSQRSIILRNIGNELRNIYLRGNVGKILNVICEEMDNHDSMASGTSGNYIKLYFAMDREKFPMLKGKLLKVTANHEYKDGLWGVLN